MLSVFQVELRHPILNSIKGALFSLPEKEKEPKKKKGTKLSRQYRLVQNHSK